MSDPAIALFKVVSDRDEIIIGFSPEALAELGGTDAGALGKALVRDGQLAAWQYLSGRKDDGELAHIASRRISILAHNSIRIEPYKPALPVVPPA